MGIKGGWGLPQLSQAISSFVFMYTKQPAIRLQYATSNFSCGLLITK